MARPSNGKKAATDEAPPVEEKKPTKRIKKKAEPKCITINVSARSEGKVALVSYGNLSSGFSFMVSQGYEVPDDWTEADVDEFRARRLTELHSELDERATDEYLALFKQSAVFTDEGEYIG
jgi:hypothetical protein